MQAEGAAALGLLLPKVAGPTESDRGCWWSLWDKPAPSSCREDGKPPGEESCTGRVWTLPPNSLVVGGNPTRSRQGTSPLPTSPAGGMLPAHESDRGSA